MRHKRYDATAIAGDPNVNEMLRYNFLSASWSDTATLATVRRVWRRTSHHSHVLAKYDLSYLLKGNRWIILKHSSLGSTHVVMPREDANVELDRVNDERPIIGIYDIIANEFRLDPAGKDVLISTSFSDLSDLYRDSSLPISDNRRAKILDVQTDELIWVDSPVTLI